MPKATKAEIATKVQRLHQLTSEQKAVDPEIESLKAWFRANAGGSDVIYRDGAGLVVSLATESRDTWDKDRLVEMLGGEASLYKKTSTFQKVSCRTEKV